MESPASGMDREAVEERKAHEATEERAAQEAVEGRKADEAADPVSYDDALAALADPDIRTASVRGWDAARNAVAGSAYLLRGLGAG